MNDTPTTENVTPLFAKRFADTTPPKPLAPYWRVKYEISRNVDGTPVHDTVYAPGYIASMMPFFMISSVENSKSLSETTFFTQAERIVDVSRVQDPDQAQA
jgi:hypothetical protein